MHKVAEKDFSKSCEAITKVVAVLALLMMVNLTAFADNAFPGWMDEVDFNKKSANSEFSGPVDPETGKISNLESKRGKGFKPKLPDFAELRKKATKTETETEGNSYTLSNSNETLKKTENKSELATTAVDLLNAITMLASDTTASISKKIEDDEPSDEELRRRRTYKPGRIKSFYIESKENERKKEETSK